MCHLSQLTNIHDVCILVNSLTGMNRARSNLGIYQVMHEVGLVQTVAQPSISTCDLVPYARRWHGFESHCGNENSYQHIDTHDDDDDEHTISPINSGFNSKCSLNTPIGRVFSSSYNVLLTLPLLFTGELVIFA